MAAADGDGFPPSKGDNFARGLVIGLLTAVLVWAILVLPILYFTGKL